MSRIDFEELIAHFCLFSCSLDLAGSGNPSKTTIGIIPDLCTTCRWDLNISLHLQKIRCNKTCG